MATVKIPLKDAPETLLYRAIETKLRNDPDLKRVVKTWQTMAGLGEPDLAPPTSANIPLLRLDMAPASAHAEAIGLTTQPVQLLITLCVDGTLLDNLLNLNGAVRNAIYAGNGTTLMLMETIKATGIKIDRPAVSSTTAAKNSQMLTGTAVLTCNLLIPTNY